MSTIAMTAEMKKADRNAFLKSLKSVEKRLGKSEAAALKIGMTNLLRSLAASTKVAPKYRDYEDTGEKSRSGLTRKFEVAGHPRSGGTVTVYAESVADLKRHRAVAIGMRGLAKKSWSRAGMKGRLNVTKAEAAKPAISRDNARRNRMVKTMVDYDAQLKGPDKYIKVTNKLNYIEAAMEGGPKSIDTAMSRAASAVEKYITRELAKA
jgi:hypothetical protein